MTIMTMKWLKRSSIAAGVMLAASFGCGLTAAADDLLPPLEELVVEKVEKVESAERVESAELIQAEQSELDVPAVAVADAGEADVEPVEAAAEASNEATDEAASSTGPLAGKPRPSRTVELPSDFAAPDRRTVIIPPRPDWVDSEPEMVDNDYCVPVSSALQIRQMDCRASLDKELVTAVNRFVADHVGNRQVNHFIKYDLDEIRERLLDNESEFSDIVEVSLGPMHQSHALLRFDSDFRADIDRRWSEILQTGRVLKTAGLSVGGLVFLVMVFGYFRLDSVTKGYYTKRLQWLLLTAILLLAGGGMLYFRSISELIYRLTV